MLQLPKWLHVPEYPDASERRLARGRRHCECKPDEAAQAVLQLTELLPDPRPVVRARAAFALARIGPQAITALPALRTGLSDPDSLVRQNAAFAIGNLGRAAIIEASALSDTINAVTSLFGDPQGLVRIEARIALRELDREVATL